MFTVSVSILRDTTHNGTEGENIESEMQDCVKHVGVLGADPELHDEVQHELDSAGHGQD